MSTFRGVNTATVETFFASFPENHKPYLVRSTESITIYKAIEGQMAIAIFKTTFTVMLQGGTNDRAHYANIFMSIHEEQSSSSNAQTSQNTESIHTITTHTEETTPASKKRKRTQYQIHNLRFNDFRDDLMAFMEQWKPNNCQMYDPSKDKVKRPSEAKDAGTQTEIIDVNNE